MAGLIHITAPASVGAGCDIELSADADSAEILLNVAAVADSVARKRETLGMPEPLTPVTVRVWRVTSGGTYQLDSMREHVVMPQLADA